MTDDQILNCDMDEFSKTKDESLDLPNREAADPLQDSEDSNDDDDFECDIERYVPFEEKLTLADNLKTCSRECLTEIIKLIQEI